MTLGHYYAIRVRGTDKYMPQLSSEHSLAEPESGVLPRLFHRMQDARTSATIWKKGLVKVQDSGKRIDWEEIPDRKELDLEIVKVEVREAS